MSECWHILEEFVVQVERRILYVNVTATLGVEMAPGATPDEVEAALDLTSLSADDPIGLLSNDPDKFFGRTTKVGLDKVLFGSCLQSFFASMVCACQGCNFQPTQLVCC